MQFVGPYHVTAIASGEPWELLGERLSLLPFLEAERSRIEAGLKPL